MTDACENVNFVDSDQCNLNFAHISFLPTPSPEPFPLSSALLFSFLYLYFRLPAYL